MHAHHMQVYLEAVVAAAADDEAALTQHGHTLYRRVSMKDKLTAWCTSWRHVAEHTNPRPIRSRTSPKYNTVICVSSMHQSTIHSSIDRSIDRSIDPSIHLSFLALIDCSCRPSIHVHGTLSLSQANTQPCDDNRPWGSGAKRALIYRPPMRSRFRSAHRVIASSSAESRSLLHVQASRPSDTCKRNAVTTRASAGSFHETPDRTMIV